MPKTMTHTATCVTLANATVTTELDLQGLWDDVQVRGDDLFIPAWSMTVAEVVAMWLSDGTATCYCDGWL